MDEEAARRAAAEDRARENAYKERVTRGSWHSAADAAYTAALPPTPARSSAMTPASGRAGAFQWSWSAGPFTRPAMGSPVRKSQDDQAEKEEDDEDYGMESVQGRSVMSGDPRAKPAGRMTHVPNLPPAPKFSGATMEDRRVFMDEYNTYLHALTALDSSVATAYQLPVSACVEERTRWRIALYDFEKEPALVSEDEWIRYFSVAFDEDRVDYEAVDFAMRKLRMDSRLPHGKSRVAKLVKDMHLILHKQGVEVSMTRKEPRKLIQYLVDALEPPDFKDKMKKRLMQEQNKPLRSHLPHFTKWLEEALKTYIMWEKPSTDSSADAKTRGGMGGQSKSSGSAGSGAKASGSKAGPPAAPAGTQMRSREAPSKKEPGTRPPCLKCGSLEHLVRKCPKVEAGEADRLLSERAQKKTVGRLQVGSPDVDAMTPSSEEHDADDAGAAARRDRGTAPALVGGVVKLDALVDTGADVSLVSGGVVAALEKAGVFLEMARVTQPQSLKPIGKGEVLCHSKIRLRELELTTSWGVLVLACVEAWVDEDDKSMALILGRPALLKLGYSTDGLLRSALRRLGAKPVEGRDGEWARREEQEDVKDREDDQDEEPSPYRIGRLRAEAVRAVGEDADDRDDLMSLPDPAPASFLEIRRVLDERQLAAVTEGLPAEEAAYLKETLALTEEVFRLSMGCDPPVKVEPLLVRLKPGATPTKCNLRRMAPLHAAYMKEHLMSLLAGGYLVRNARSRWASPPRVVPKHNPGDFRMTVDVRGVNERTEAMPWPMPILEVILTFLVLARYYYQLDGDKMFWQLPLHVRSQELYTIMTAYGMFSPTRVLMGQTDAPAFCQQAMEKIFATQLHHELLVWMDDILGHAPTPMKLMENLRRTLLLCKEFGVKLNPSKCVFFTKEATFCGRTISAHGIGYTPERISGLIQMATPRTAADLQQFLCAVNWMRMSIPNYTTIVAPLMALLEVAAKDIGSRKKKKLVRVELLQGLWQHEHQCAYEKIKSALAVITPLAHPDAKAVVCVFTDASLDHWGAAITQIKPGEDLSVITEREHAPLAFLSGSFVGSAMRWPIVEKEAFAIVETCKRLEYLLLREAGFRLYTDHRNLVYIFDPHATDASMARYQADKLQRWAMTMMMFRYSIWHISGEDNVWGDLLSRWGATDERGPVTRVGVLAVVDAISPLQMPEFQWPTMEEVARIQREHLAARDPNGPLPEVKWSEEVMAFTSADGDKVWVPDDAIDLQQRLMVIAHAGAAGHRGQAVTIQNVKDVFYWPTLIADVKEFVRGCIHCMSVRGEKIPRPFAEVLHATKPNEVLHFDFLSMPLGNDVSKYVLVLKDDMSGFVELVECQTADSDEVLTSLLDWFKRFGIVNQWVSDQGAHFKNAVIEDLRRVLGSQHHFVTAYCPWANGTVEVVNNMLLKIVKALLSELKLHPSQWPVVLPVVQAALNSSPADRLGGVAPLTAFTQLPATRPLQALLHPKTQRQVTVKWVKAQHLRYLEETREALDGIHQRITEETDAKRKAARVRQGLKPTVIMPEFCEGDFVLVGQVLSHANKLALRWQGPKRIVRVVHDRIFEVENLLPPFETTVHHASRLQWYADAKREITEDLLAHARHTDGGHLVEKILDCRMGPETHQLEIQIQWIGLDPLEASWERAVELIKDVPVLVRRYLDTLPEGKKRNELETLMGKAVKAKGKTKDQPKATSKSKAKRSSTATKPAKKGGGK